MFRKKSDDELWRLQQELIAVEEEEFEEYEEETDDPDLEDLEEYLEEDYEEYLDSDEEEEEEYEEEPVYRNFANRYGRGNPKKFSDDDFFDADEFDDGDVLYRRDYKKAKRKKRRKAFGLMILAVLELIAIGAIILWFVSWLQ